MFKLDAPDLQSHWNMLRHFLFGCLQGHAVDVLKAESVLPAITLLDNTGNHIM
jgi:hypothetical protein